MPNRHRPEHLQEIRTLRHRCLTMVGFMEERSNLGSLGAELRSVVETTASKQDLRGMRTLFRDIFEMSRGMTPALVVEMDREVERVSGAGSEALRTGDLDELHEIVRRGRIRNERECRLVLNYLDSATGAELPVELRTSLSRMARDFGPVP
jgi:hypothetical protein